MKMKALLIALPVAMIPATVLAANTEEGYYGSAKYLQIEQRAKEMDTSARPGVGQFVGGKEKEHFGGAAIAAGYQFGNGWRTEGNTPLNKKRSTPAAPAHSRTALTTCRPKQNV